MTIRSPAFCIANPAALGRSALAHPNLARAGLSSSEKVLGNAVDYHCRHTSTFDSLSPETRHSRDELVQLHLDGGEARRAPAALAQRVDVLLELAPHRGGRERRVACVERV